MEKEVAFRIVLMVGVAILGAVADDPLQYFDWTVSYAELAPLGVTKRVIVINDEFPGPELRTVTNNVVSVNVHNSLDEPLLITWHGIQHRKACWQDGVPGTNCAIPAGWNWTFTFQVKDQIGSFFYFPSLFLHRTAGGYGGISVVNRNVIAVPFAPPADEFTLLIGDFYNIDHKDLRSSLDNGILLGKPDGIVINGRGPYQTILTVQPGATYRLRISNVGTKTSLNFRIQGHKMILVETEGSYTLQDYYSTLDIHVGQSYSVLVTADQSPGSFYIVASSRFIQPTISGIAVLRYSNALPVNVSGPLPEGPDPMDYVYSVNQARAIRWNLTTGAARPNPQGSFHYGQINVSRTIVLQSTAALIGGKRRFAVNGVSFVNPDTPLKLADYFQIKDVYSLGGIPDTPSASSETRYGTPVIDALNRAFIQIVFQNTEDTIQAWHMDGYAFFVVGMDSGLWDIKNQPQYNMIDAVARSTTQVSPIIFVPAFSVRDFDIEFSECWETLGRSYTSEWEMAQIVNRFPILPCLQTRFYAAEPSHILLEDISCGIWPQNKLSFTGIDLYPCQARIHLMTTIRCFHVRAGDFGNTGCEPD